MQREGLCTTRIVAVPVAPGWSSAVTGSIRSRDRLHLDHLGIEAVVSVMMVSADTGCTASAKPADRPPTRLALTKVRRRARRDQHRILFPALHRHSPWVAAVRDVVNARALTGSHHVPLRTRRCAALAGLYPCGVSKSSTRPMTGACALRSSSPVFSMARKTRTKLRLAILAMAVSE